MPSVSARLGERLSRSLRQGGLRLTASLADGGSPCALVQQTLATLSSSKLAHGLRKQPTASEALLWSALRGRRLGVALRRRCVIGPFIVDFVAAEVRLVVEVDGGYHAERRRADQRRDEALGRLGYRILRLDAGFVARDVSPPSRCSQRELRETDGGHRFKPDRSPLAGPSHCCADCLRKASVRILPP